VLQRDYRPIGTTAGFTWYADRNLGEEQLRRLTRILDSDP
jgi:hypothetical protein